MSDGDRIDPGAGAGDGDRDADDFQALAGEYVLGTLPGAARRDLEQRLPRDAALRAAVDDWSARLLPLTALAEPAEPSPALWGRIEAAIDAASEARTARRSPATAPPRPRWSAWWESLALWRGLAAAGFAAALLLAVLPAQRAPGGPQYVVVLVAPGSQSPGWVVQAASTRQLNLQPLAPTPLPPAKALQFWTKGEGWAGPVSLGLVTPGQPLRVPLDKLPPLQPNQLFEITLEPEQGSPIGRPTGPILYIGRAVRLEG